jgi:hypothetical protein
VRALGMTLFMASACASPQPWRWVVDTSPKPLETIASNPNNALGKGLLLTHDGLLLMPCFKAVESISSGGITSLVVQRLDLESATARKPVVREMIEAIYDPKQPVKPVPLLLELSIRGLRHDLDEKASTLRKDVKEYINNGHPDSLFAACGTKLITAVERRAALYALLVAYPKTVEARNAIELTLQRRLIGSRGNTMRTLAFDDLAAYPFTFMISSDSDVALAPLDFPLGRLKGRSIRDLLPKLSRFLLQAKSGTIIRQVSRPWRELPVAAKVTRSLAEDPSKGLELEQRFGALRFLSLLRESGKRRLVRAQVLRSSVASFLRADRCIKDLKPVLDNKVLEACSAQEMDYRTLGCRRISKRLSDVLLGSACAPLGAVTIASADPLLLPALRRPLLLRPEPPAKGAAGLPPVGVPFGQGFNHLGQALKGTCIKGDPSDFLDDNQQILRTEITFKNGGDDRRTLWQRFWGAVAPPDQLLSLSVRQVSRMLMPSFTLDEAAEKLAKKDIRGFLARCGTHYVARGIHHRGLEIGVRQKDGLVRVQSTARGMGELALKSQLLKDHRLERLLANQGALRLLFEDSKHALTDYLTLMPWSNYLVERGILNVDALLPAPLKSSAAAR